MDIFLKVFFFWHTSKRNFEFQRLIRGCCLATHTQARESLSRDKTQSEEKWEELSSCQSDLVEVQTAKKMF